MVLRAAEGCALVHKRPDILEAWKGIALTIRRLSGLRNMVAHGTACLLGPNDTLRVTTDCDDQGQYVLSPAFYNTQKTSKDNLVQYWYNAATVNEIRDAIARAIYEVDRFVAIEVLGKSSVVFPKAMMMRRIPSANS